MKCPFCERREVLARNEHAYLIYDPRGGVRGVIPAKQSY